MGFSDVCYVLIGLGQFKECKFMFEQFFVNLIICIIVMFVDINLVGDIFGGWLMSQMDFVVGLIVVLIVCGCSVIIVVEGMKFYCFVKVGDEVLFYVDLIYVGCILMCIYVEVWWCECDSDDIQQVIEVIFIFVVINEDGSVCVVRGD